MSQFVDISSTRNNNKKLNFFFDYKAVYHLVVIKAFKHFFCLDVKAFYCKIHTLDTRYMNKQYKLCSIKF